MSRNAMHHRLRKTNRQCQMCAICGMSNRRPTCLHPVAIPPAAIPWTELVCLTDVVAQCTGYKNVAINLQRTHDAFESVSKADSHPGDASIVICLCSPRKGWLSWIAERHVLDPLVLSLRE